MVATLPAPGAGRRSGAHGRPPDEVGEDLLHHLRMLEEVLLDDALDILRMLGEVVAHDRLDLAAQVLRAARDGMRQSQGNDG
jgi:hypothetical protein